jgi:hypothetical protein
MGRRGRGAPRNAEHKEENMSLSHKAVLPCLLGSLLLVPTAALAQSSAPTAPKTDSHAQSQTDDKRKALIADATSAIQETQAALKHLDDGKAKDALASLERATGKLDIILAREPKLQLAPASVSAVTYDVAGGLDAVKAARKHVEALMEEGRVQEARRLLRPLASETVISVSNIPLATYPDAIKAAAKLIDDQKLDTAKEVLQTALNTQVITETVIPLPVVHAEGFLKTAEGLAEKKNRTKEENDQLKSSMDRARNQLEFAQALGYGTKKDFDKLYQQLTEIDQKTANNQSGTGWFSKIKASIADFMKSSQSSQR